MIFFLSAGGYAYETVSLKIKESSRFVSRILYPGYAGIPVIYLCDLPLPVFALTRSKRAALYPSQAKETGMYLILQPIRRTASGIAAGTGKLLPYLLTFTPV